MALTELQRAICRLLAELRIRSGESYVAGGAALNELLGASRQSHDIDLCRLDPSALEEALAVGRLEFRTGSIRGVLPTFRAIEPTA